MGHTVDALIPEDGSPFFHVWCGIMDVMTGTMMVAATSLAVIGIPSVFYGGPAMDEVSCNTLFNLKHSACAAG